MLSRLLVLKELHTYMSYEMRNEYHLNCNQMCKANINKEIESVMKKDVLWSWLRHSNTWIRQILHEMSNIEMENKVSSFEDP